MNTNQHEFYFKLNKPMDNNLIAISEVDLGRQRLKSEKSNFPEVDQRPDTVPPYEGSNNNMNLTSTHNLEGSSNG